MYHGTKQHEKVDLITAAPKERQIWKHFVLYIETESTKELTRIFHLPSYDPQQELPLSCDPALFSCSPSQRDRRVKEGFFLNVFRTL